MQACLPGVSSRDQEDTVMAEDSSSVLGGSLRDDPLEQFPDVLARFEGAIPPQPKPAEPPDTFSSARSEDPTGTKLPAIVDASAVDLASSPQHLTHVIEKVRTALAEARSVFEYVQCRAGARVVEEAALLARSREFEIHARELVIRAEFEVQLLVPRGRGGRGVKNPVRALAGFSRRQLQTWRSCFGELSRVRLEELLSEAREAREPVRREAIRKAAKLARDASSPVRTRAVLPAPSSVTLSIRGSWERAARSLGMDVAAWMERVLDEAAKR